MNPVKLSKAGTIQAARLLALLASLLLLNACDGPPQASDTTKDVEAPKEKTPIVEVAPTSEPTPESQTTPATPVEPAPKPISEASPITLGEPIIVTLYPHLNRSIGGVTTFSREQYITIHEAPNGDEWEYFQNDLQVSYGRDGGLRGGVRKRIPEDPRRPGYPDVAVIKKQGAAHQAKEKRAAHIRPELTREMVHCTHPEHYFAKPNQAHAAWGPKTYEAAAEFTAHFLKEFWTDESRPRYLEVFNEPFVHAKDVGATVETFSEQHVVVARRIKELTPDVLVGGYAAAWVEVEAQNFEHWNKWQKTFMDIAGKDMDFFSYHIYDGINVVGEARNRTGSNTYAIIDLIDQYSHLLLGVAKPQVISEYGLIPEGNMGSMPYSAQRSAAMIRSTNAQLMTFMDHPDRIIKTVPFFLDKALWTYGMKNEHIPGEANPFLLRRKLADGSFVFTDLVKFYEYWKDINGQWLHSRTSDPDLRCHFLQDDKQLNVIMSNLETDARTVDLTGLENVRVHSVVKRSLRTDGDAPVLSDQALDSIPTSLTLHACESVILMIETQSLNAPSATVTETRNYATEYMKPIQANEPIEFTFRRVPTGQGDAMLRLSFGREHGTTRKPDVRFNNQLLDVPDDWAGDDQLGRTTFFGMLEIAVPIDLIHRTNTISITFPDSGGKVACAVLQTNLVGR
ncbi:MAG: beta-agarase [Lentimonas sp.]